MKSRILGTAAVVAALLAASGIAGASTPPDTAAPGSDEALAKQVRHELVMYPHYTIFDDVSYRVDHGTVELTGAVNQPYKKSDIEKIVAHVPGVASVNNRLEVLPLSSFDDRLRLQVARAIYSDPVLSRYGMQVVPPIHIIVDNGHVTLTGVVNNNMEKQVAGTRAATVGLSFGPMVNNLRVDTPSAKKG
jgi:hyperosmotically inducible protein